MERKSVRKLKIDKGFKELIRPLFKQEYLQLEQNLLTDGCRDPIITWNGYIIDGHNRYEICTRHKIPFAVLEMEFECRESVVAWICANQLGRRNLTAETRKFLIGMQYESEKIVNSKKNALGINQFTGVDSATPYVDCDPEEHDAKILTKRKTAARIAEQNHISHGTVEKYAIYSRALEEIGQKAPEVVPKILSGRYKISHNNVRELAKLSSKEIKQFVARIEQMQQPFIQYNRIRKELKNPQMLHPVESSPTVKDMPQFDPDADVTGLTLTIPSWSSSINRIRTQTDLMHISESARLKLEKSLVELNNHIVAMLTALRRT